MAFPFVGEDNFEDGTIGNFNSETDTGSALSIDHYTELARIPGLAMPYRGAYCIHVDLPSVSTEAYLQEDDDWDLAADGSEQFWRFRLWVDPNIVMADTDEFIIWQLQSAGPVSEAVMAINFTNADGLRLGIGETAATSFRDLSTGVWHTVEIDAVNSATATGTIDAWLDGGAFAQVGSLTQAAITQGRIGVMAIDAGTTAGHILIDDIVTDDARLGYDPNRFEETVLLTKSGHAFVGAGHIDNATLVGGGTADGVVTLYDTDTADTSLDPKLILQDTAAGEIVDPAGVPIQMKRGAYLVLAGTDPRAIVKFSKTPAFGSDAAIRSFAHRRG